MNNPIFISIKGSTQGLITEGTFTPESVGNSYQKGHENEALIKGFSHDIKIPRDPQSGQPSGQRVHEPLVISKIFDKCSPLLYNALTKGETLTEVELKWYRTSYAGKPEHYFTIKLEDAVIVDISSYMDNEEGLDKTQVAPLEKVSFAYRKITWRHETASTSGEDDWRIGVGLNA
ncbi:type VI secretion system tube protein Hcp [Malaciobacter molluscorum LMG 25693]|uniref:Type VI secretion system tube protein Hcp n=1 Tax=Malaciobacter molluscorum LMG 25693 TaxID=870501 RepID=A0A2G1DI38_9BACT|nr:Hcp family type VI secretion system effector [Malaciobacter molluscorum]AXX92444.1 type VI secretion system, inner tube protein [Malaciobacter molluscorum LMG 25693]PHO18110.1 type VI secretion system tube protein Hcp [Malaciobacter molluscorum LMG 25693]RXJ93900.1 type VI secretion system tube protein Hcp [Malaciobacter molluscorum]